MKNIKFAVLFICTSFLLNQLSAENELVIVKKDSIKKEAQPNQVIKWNISQLVFTNFSFQYEYGFHKNMSGALGISFLIPRDIPSSIYSTTVGTEGFQFPKFGGWSITPEFRFYPGKKIEHQAPHGFYLAPYLRYSKYSVKGDYLDVVTNSNGTTQKNDYAMTASYGGVNGGLMIGSQWLIGKHFSIDWWILGLGAGKAKFIIESVSKDPNLNLSAAEQAQLKTDISGNIGDLGSFGSGSVSIETTSNSAKVTVSGVPMASYRAFGLCLGFTF